MLIALLDHHDSFVHVLAEYVAALGAESRVVRVDTTDLPAIVAMAPDGIILSPGPGAPKDYPLTLDLIRALGPATPILGVCLGHQCIGAAHDAGIVRAIEPRHGMTSPIRHDAKGVFRGLPTPFDATRYHSLVIAREGVPDQLVVSAWADDDGEIMGVRHHIDRVEGVQFHPESILSEHGHDMIRNFLDQVSARGPGRAA